MVYSDQAHDNDEKIFVYPDYVYKMVGGMVCSWFSYSNILGKKIQVIGERETIVGVVSDVDDSGCLILKTDMGIKKILTGDIKFL